MTSLFRMLCRNFILPETGKPCPLFLPFSFCAIYYTLSTFLLYTIQKKPLYATFFRQVAAGSMNRRHAYALYEVVGDDAEITFEFLYCFRIKICNLIAGRTLSRITVESTHRSSYTPRCRFLLSANPVLHCLPDSIL